MSYARGLLTTNHLHPLGWSSKYCLGFTGSLPLSPPSTRDGNRKVACCLSLHPVVISPFFPVKRRSVSTETSHPGFRFTSSWVPMTLKGALLQDGRLQIMNGVITPVNGLKKVGNWGYSTPVSGVVSLLISGRGPSCVCQYVCQKTRYVVTVTCGNLHAWSILKALEMDSI